MPKTIVITGSSDGIGAAAARELHHDGHEVVVVGRSPQKTEAVAREIGANHFIADFTRLEQVRKLAAELDGGYRQIDVLANNAGGVFGDRTRTVDGFEKTFQVNHLAPFLLTRLLIDKLIASAATVVQTSSVAARMAGKLDTDDLNHEGISAPYVPTTPPSWRTSCSRRSCTGDTTLWASQRRPSTQETSRPASVLSPRVGS